MPTRTLQPNSHLAVRFERAQRSVYESIFVESERQVDVYVMDDIGLADFRNSEAFDSLGDSLNRKRHYFKVRIPPNRRCYLVLVNWNDEAVAVHYEVGI